MGSALKDRGHTLAVAESLTGGLLASTFAQASGSSEWFRGGIVAYSSAVKYDLLDVPDGPVVSEAAAVAMARGASVLLQADVAVTGAGGPDPQDGQPPGTVWAATWPVQLGGAVLLRLSGSPESICEQVLRTGGPDRPGTPRIGAGPSRLGRRRTQVRRCTQVVGLSGWAGEPWRPAPPTKRPAPDAAAARDRRPCRHSLPMASPSDRPDCS